MKRLEEQETARGPLERPSEIESRWQEHLPEGKGGIYVMRSQGAIVNSLRYIRGDGKEFNFQEDEDAIGDEGCKWP